MIKQNKTLESNGLSSQLENGLEQKLSELNDKKERVWRRIQKVGIGGIITIASGLPLVIVGLGDTNQRDREPQYSKIVEETEDSLEAYRIVRSPILDYAWGAVLAGNLICAGGASAFGFILQRIQNEEKRLRKKYGE